MFRNVYMETYKSTMKNNSSLENIMCHLNFVYSALGAIIQDIQYTIGSIILSENERQQNRMLDQQQEKKGKFIVSNGKLRMPKNSYSYRQSEPLSRLSPMDLQTQNRKAQGRLSAGRNSEQSGKKQPTTINEFLNVNRKSKKILQNNQKLIKQNQIDQSRSYNGLTFGNNTNGVSSINESTVTFGNFQRNQNQHKHNKTLNNYLVQIREDQQQDSKPVHISQQQKRRNISQDSSICEMGPTMYEQSYEKQRHKLQSQNQNKKNIFDSILQEENIGKASKGSFQQFCNQFGQRKQSFFQNNQQNSLKTNKMTNGDVCQQQIHIQPSLESQDDFMKHIFNKKKR